MSIIVKGVDMPKRCIECPLCMHIQVVNSPLLVYACSGKGMRAMYSHETAEGVDKFCKMQKPDWCPLVEVPTPHGRLIDSDRMLRDCEYPEVETYTRVALKSTPTVIEAEE